MNESVEVSFPLGPVVVQVEATIESGHEDELHAWYREDHLPAVLACPGFITGGRYERVDQEDGTSRFMAMYVIEDVSALATQELSAVKGFGPLTPLVTYERRIYKPI